MSNFWGKSKLDEILESDELFKTKTNEISQAIITKQYDLSQLVEGLGPALTSTTAATRSIATKFLSQTLSKLPKDLLDATQVKFMAEFYCDRLRDQHTVIPNVILGILVISTLENLSEEQCRNFLSSLFLHVPCQAQLREERENIYNIIKILSERYTKDLQKLGPDYVKNVIGAIEGERDPRNLLLIFSYMPEFIGKFDLGILSEEMFEIFECYFPIDFHPTRDDPTSITREILAGELAMCLCADLSFFEKCIELVLEKLDSDLIVAKLDSLNLLKTALQKFPIKLFDEVFEKLWSALRIEVLPGSTKEITVSSLDVLQLAINATTADNIVAANMLRTIFDSILAPLADNKNRLFQPSLTIVLTILDGNNVYSKIWIGNKIMQLFLNGIESSDEMKYQILDIIEKTLGILSQKKVLFDLDSEMLMQMQSELIKFLETSDYKMLQKIFNCIEKIAEFVILENRNIIYCKINQILHLESGDTDGLRMIPLIVEFARHYSSEVYSRIVQTLLENNIEKSVSAASATEIYKIICALINVEFFTNYSINYIFNQLFNLKNYEILDIFNDFLRIQNTSSDLTEILYKKYRIIDRAIEFVRAHEIETANLLKLSKILSAIVQSLSIDNQIAIIDNYLAQLKLQDKNDFFIASGLLGNISAETNLTEYFETLTTDITNIALTTTDNNVKEECHRLLCTLINKSGDNPGNKSVVRKIVKLLKGEIKHERDRAVEVLAWVAKGLLVKGDTDAVELIEDLIKLLEHPKLSAVAVLAFDIISVEFPQLHLPIVKFLFKQKLFHIFMNKVIATVVSLTSNHLTALAYVLKVTPHQVVKSNITKVGPILFQCLNLESVKAILISLEIIEKLIGEKDDYLKNYLSKLVPEFLRLATYKPSMKIRMLALNAIATLPTSYPTLLIVPFKHDILYGLLPCLDDHKRLVRNVAVRARSLWFVI